MPPDQLAHANAFALASPLENPLRGPWYWYPVNGITYYKARKSVTMKIKWEVMWSTWSTWHEHRTKWKLWVPDKNWMTFRTPIGFSNHWDTLPGFSLLLRERTLVKAGHVKMRDNKLLSGDRSSTKFCRLEDGILPGVVLLQNGAWVSHCVQIALLSASYSNILVVC